MRCAVSAAEVPPFLAHGDQAGVGEVHRLIGVLANQLADARMVFAEIPWADDEALGHGRQDRPRIAKKTVRLRTAPRTNSATRSLPAAAALSHRAFSSARNRIVSVSLMSAVSHKGRCVKASHWRAAVVFETREVGEAVAAKPIDAENDSGGTQ
jgi:hypothetical protein